jgi:hypothetical protein
LDAVAVIAPLAPRVDESGGDDARSPNREHCTQCCPGVEGFVHYGITMGDHSTLDTHP